MEKLRSISQSRTEPASRVERARILLGYWKDPSFYAVGQALGLHPQTVQRCVERAAVEGPVAALDDRPRPGREPTITVEAKAWLTSLACRKAKELGYPHELWTTRLLASHAREHGPALGHACLANLAQGTVCKVLGQEEVKPHKVRYYLEQRDPEFAEKMAEVLCVYRKVKLLKKAASSREQEAARRGGDHLLRREARYPGARNDVSRSAARTRRPCDLRTRLRIQASRHSQLAGRHRSADRSGSCPGQRTVIAAASSSNSSSFSMRPIRSTRRST